MQCLSKPTWKECTKQSSFLFQYNFVTSWCLAALIALSRPFWPWGTTCLTLRHSRSSACFSMGQAEKSSSLPVSAVFLLLFCASLCKWAFCSDTNVTHHLCTVDCAFQNLTESFFHQISWLAGFRVLFFKWRSCSVEIHASVFWLFSRSQSSWFLSF